MKTYELLKDIGTYKAGSKFESPDGFIYFPAEVKTDSVTMKIPLDPFTIHLLVESGVLKDCDEKWEPKSGEDVFLSDIGSEIFWRNYCWFGDTEDLHRLSHNLVFKTKEEAIARSKELLAIKE